MKSAWLIAITALVATPAAAQQAMQQYVYTARTEAPLARQGAVTAGALTWQCQGNECRITGPWLAPGASACAQLAQEVGRIVSYGRVGAMLGAAGLATCNAGLTQPMAPQQIIRPQVNRVTGPVVQSPNVAVAVPEMSFVGGGTVALATRTTTAVTTPELSFVGGATGTAAPPTSIAVTVPELSFVGR